MISVDTNYTNLRSAEAGVEWRIVNGSNTFTVANLISGKISAGLMENVSIGNCISAELDLELWGVTVDSSNPLVVQFRADGGTTWYTKGTFYIDTLEKSPYTENTSVKAFDAMLKAEVGYMASGVWANPTDNTVVGNIAADLGIAIESATASALSTNPITLTNAPHIGANGTTDREMLSYIAMLRGGNWKINSANELQLAYPSTTPTDIAQADLAVRNFAASETLTVSKVKVIVDSETYYLAPSNITEDAWKALAGYCIEIELPFYGTQAVANSLYTQYNGKSFVPYQAEGAYVDPKYEVGDGIRFQKDSTYYTSIIANQDIDISWLCPSDLELKGEKKLESLYPYLTPRERQTLYQFGELENAVDSAQSAASAAQSAVGGANYREQIIYISKPSGTNTVSANTTWVTDATGNQNTWTTTRPVYDGSYPVLFVATQRQSVSQSSGTTCTCTTPVKDQTTTVIDGGHITTGTIDASVVTVSNINANNITTGKIQDASGKNYWNLATGQFVTQQGTIAGFTIDQTSLHSGTVGIGTAGTSISEGKWESTKTGTKTSGGTSYQYTAKSKISNFGIDLYSAVDGVDADFVPVLEIKPEASKVSGVAKHSVLITTLDNGASFLSIAKASEVSANSPVGTFGRHISFTDKVSMNGKGVAFGKVAETDNLVDSEWDVRAPWFIGSLGFIRQLTSADDLNNILTFGKYYQPSNGSANTPANSPTTNAFALYVVSSNGTKDMDGAWRYANQYLKDLFGNIWHRTIYTEASGTLSYSGWKIILSTNTLYTLSPTINAAAVGSWTLGRCTGTIVEAPSIMTNTSNSILAIFGRLRITSFTRTGNNPYISLLTTLRPSSAVNFSCGFRFNGTDSARPEQMMAKLATDGTLNIETSETITNIPNEYFYALFYGTTYFLP